MLPHKRNELSESAETAKILPSRVMRFEADRVQKQNTRGTGCTLSAGLATQQAELTDWPQAVRATNAWLLDGLRHADELHVAHGNGPINHFHSLWRHQSHPKDIRP